MLGEDFLIKKALQWAWRKLDGKKTYISGIHFLLLGLIGLIRFISPELSGAIPTDVDGILKDFGIGWGAVGGGHKLKKMETHS